MLRYSIPCLLRDINTIFNNNIMHQRHTLRSMKYPSHQFQDGGNDAHDKYHHIQDNDTPSRNDYDSRNELDGADQNLNCYSLSYLIEKELRDARRTSRVWIIRILTGWISATSATSAIGSGCT